MSGLPLIITNAGLAKLAAGGVTLTTTGLSDTAFTADPTMTAVPGQFKTLAALSGEGVGPSEVHMVVSDTSADAYSLYGYGMIDSDGDLFALYGQSTPVLEKAASSEMMLAIDLMLSTAGSDAITFGNTNFLNPPASETVVGVTRFATEAEVAAGTDDTIAITPANLKAMLMALFPRGTIIDWYGTAAAVPATWHICDGTNGTPDLRGQFVVGANGDAGAETTFPVGATGGSATQTVTVEGHALTVAEMPLHGHTGEDTGHGHGVDQTAHGHTLDQSPHGHGVTDPQHGHGVNDPQHLHEFGAVVQTGVGNNLGGGGGQYESDVANTSLAATNISIQAAATGISIQGADADISLEAANANVSIETGNAAIEIGETGGGGVHVHPASATTNLPPYVAMYRIMKL